MITIKEIKLAQDNSFVDLSDKELTEAFGVINLYRKEFSGLESRIKTAIQDRFSNTTGFTTAVQQQLSFPTGVVDLNIAPVFKDVYTLDISPEELIENLIAAGLDPDHVHDMIPAKYSATQTVLRSLYSSSDSGILSAIKSSIKLNTNSTLDIKVKGE